MIVTDILFKAKCKDKDMWVEGFYFNMPDKTRRYEESWRKDIIPVGSYIASPSPDGLEIHEVDGYRRLERQENMGTRHSHVRWKSRRIDGSCIRKIQSCYTPALLPRH